LAALSLIALLAAPAFSADWDKLLGNDPSIEFGVRLGGPEPFERDTARIFAPASNAKLFTGIAALETLGPDFRFETRIEWTDVAPGAVTDLRVFGSGDPSWGVPELGEGLRSRLDAFAARIRADGVREIRGPIRFVAADERWDALPIPPGWDEEDRTSCYGVMAQAFELQLGCATFVVTSPTRGHWKEPGVPTSVTLAIGAGTETALTIGRARPGDLAPATAFVIRGTWKAGAGPVEVQLPVNDSKAWAAALFARALAAAGIRLVPADARALTPIAAHSRTFFSPPLSKLLVPFMKESINVIGEALYLTLGARADGAAALDDAGRDALARFTGVLGPPGAAVSLVDGSGISRKDTVSVDALYALLERERARPEFPLLWSALPIAGVDGTLADRMNGTPAQGVLRAKTGTLTGVYNLSGYVPRRARGAIVEYVPFVILAESASADLVDSRAAEDRVGAALAALIRAEGVTAGF
jgi:D-alanyl-D-alanine carboxypeptidase/D-alanyl-D-alanine-endopeptidase (penicillin-binding protein 4)